MVIVSLACALLLTGCVSTPGSNAISGTPVVTASPPTSATPSTASVVAVDPARYPVAPHQLSEGVAGVMFTAGSDGLQCAIFDPLAADNTFAKPPEFGCVVSVDGYPYPPLTGGPVDTANAFLSWSNEAARATNVTDASFSGDSPAPALPAGTSITWNSVTCTAVAGDDVRCVDASSGHGMRVSVHDYELF